MGNRICSEYVHAARASVGEHTAVLLGIVPARQRSEAYQGSVMTRTMTIFTAALFAAVAAAASDIKPVYAFRTKDVAAVYLDALAELETGGNDLAVGTHGEVGAWQCLPSVWKQFTRMPIASAQCHATALEVVLKVIVARTGKNPAELTPAAFAMAWHCPNARHLNRERRDYCARFCNLVAEKLTK